MKFPLDWKSCASLIRTGIHFRTHLLDGGPLARVREHQGLNERVAVNVLAGQLNIDIDFASKRLATVKRVMSAFGYTDGTLFRKFQNMYKNLFFEEIVLE